MALVDYSESESSGSETEQPAKPVRQMQANGKKPFQKIVDRSNPGKIVVNLPGSSSIKDDSASQPDEPPAKRARTAGGGIFSGFSSFLPAPKNANAQIPSKSSTSQIKPPGIGLRTSAAAAFSRDSDYTQDDSSSGSMILPPPKRDAEPYIPEGQKPASEVKLTGKPLMFKPLSVARSTKKKPTKPITQSVTAVSASVKASTASKSNATATNATVAAPIPPPKPVSLFSMHTEEDSTPLKNTNNSYEPMFETGNAYEDGVTSSYEEYAASYSQQQSIPPANQTHESLDNIANDLNLSAAARRELFGRGGNAGQSAKQVINFNMDEEYKHNETVRASGETHVHNPVRGIQSGKHSLRQLVNSVQGQREALEESFAQGKNNRKEASGRYGW